MGYDVAVFPNNTPKKHFRISSILLQTRSLHSNSEEGGASPLERHIIIPQVYAFSTRSTLARERGGRILTFCYPYQPVQ
jgi:hypothetical protein